MCKREQNPLTDHIRAVLHQHHEPYVLGSWERFSRHKLQKEKKRRNKILLNAAAAILLAATITSVFTWSPPDPTSQSYIVEELPPSPEQNSGQADGILTPVEAEAPSAPDEHPGNLADKGFQDSESAIAENLSTETEVGWTGTHEPARIGYQTVAEYRFSDTAQQAAIKPARFRSISGDTEKQQTATRIPEAIRMNNLAAGSYNSYSGESDIGRYVPDQHRKSVSLSLAYASVMNIHDSQTSLGMGGGVYTDWDVTEKFSLTSGLLIAQNQLKYNIDHGELSRTFEKPETEVTLSGSGELNHIRVDLVSLEIPLSVRYSINDNFSFSAGVSSITFLKERYDYEFEFEQRIQVFVTNDEGLHTRTELVTVSETYQQSEPSLNGMDWAAFYTFSAGYRFDVASRHTFMIEPFIKIPNRQVASRDIKYSTGGLQLKMSF